MGDVRIFPVHAGVQRGRREAIKHTERRIFTELSRLETVVAKLEENSSANTNSSYLRLRAAVLAARAEAWDFLYALYAQEQADRAEEGR